MREQRCDKSSQLVIWYRDFLENGKSAAFVSCVATRYASATLERLTFSDDHEVRRAAVLALGMVGSFGSIDAVARRLRDPDRCVRVVAEISFGDLSLRQMGNAGERSLNCVRRHIEGHRYGRAAKMLVDCTGRWPEFADAWYLSGVVAFCLGQYSRATKFAHKTIDLNRFHFQAHALEARCWMELDRAEKALRCFEKSFWLNPSQLSVKSYIDTLRRQQRLNDSA